MNDKLRMAVLERLNEVSKKLNVQILEIQAIASDLRMNAEPSQSSVPSAALQKEPMTQTPESHDFDKMQASISRLEELVLNLQSPQAQNAISEPSVEEAAPASKINSDQKPNRQQQNKQNKKWKSVQKPSAEVKPAPLVLDESKMVKTDAIANAKAQTPAAEMAENVKNPPKADPLLLTDPVKK